MELRRRRSNPLGKLFFYMGFLIVSAALGFCILMLIPVPQPSFRLMKAEGTEIYNRAQKTWRPLETGEEISAGSRIRTYKIGWADLTTEGAALKLIGGSELEISRLYIWDRRPRLHLIRGYFYCTSQDPGIAVAVGQIAPEVFQSPLFAALSFYTMSGKYAAGFDPSIGHVRIYAVENLIQMKSWFPWKKIVLQEKQTAEIFIHPFSLDVTALSKEELARLEDGIKRITQSPAAPAVKPAVQKAAVPPPAPQTGVIPAPPETKASAPGGKAWDLNSFSIYKTKSSAADWKQNEFRYEVPSPESIAGVTFSNAGMDGSAFKTLKLQILPLQGAPCPENLRIEIKSNERVLRVLTSKLNPTGGALLFPVRLAASSPLTEISLLVSHAKAGAAVKGGFRVSELSFS